jgi:hypothetical protein
MFENLLHPEWGGKKQANQKKNNRGMAFCLLFSAIYS